MTSDATKAITDKYRYIDAGDWAVSRAYGYLRAPTESPLAYFNGASRPEAPRRTKTRPRTHVTHATATRARGRSIPPLVANQEIHGYIHRAIADLPPLQNDWVQSQYRKNAISRRQHCDAFRRQYFERYRAEHLQKSHMFTRRVCRYLIDFVISRERGDPQPDWCDVSADAWRQTYRPHHKRIRAEIGAIGEDALYALGVALEGKNS